jgi:predicted unusual protein kinase regulating ubiquinone biosynthesis (AarF/ABC1/UbiB family)
MDSGPLIEQLFRAYLKQVLIDGIFHADPHPGNVFLTEDKRIALLDLGMVGHTAPNMQENLLKMLLAISDGKSEEAADIVIQISEKVENPDLADFKRRVRQVIVQTQNVGLQRMNVGQSLIAVSRAAGQTGLFVPSELTLLGKTLLQLDEVGRTLDPEFDPNAAIRRNATELMKRRMTQDATQGGMFSQVLEIKNFMTALPKRLNQVMDAMTSSGVEVKVRAVDAKMVVDGMHKIANRITAGVILASMIIGASLMMRIPTDFEIFGYPGIAILTFLFAAGGGLYLLLTIFFHDDKVLRKPPR